MEASGGYAEAEHVATAAQIADLIVVNQAAPVCNWQNLERELGQVTIRGDQQPSAIPECRSDPVK